MKPLIRSDNDGPLPVGKLMARMRDRGIQAEIKRSDIILGVHPTSGEHIGLFYGIGLVRRVWRRISPEEATVLIVPVDVNTDDVEVLYDMVKTIKGACCFGKTGEK